MDSNNLRQIAARNIHRVLRENAYLNLILKQINSDKKYSDSDKKYLYQTISGVVTWKIKLDWIIDNLSNRPIKKIEHKLLNYLYIGLHNILHLDSLPDYATINEVVEAAKRECGAKSSGFLNAILRSFLKSDKNISLPEEADSKTKHLSVKYSHPEWMIERWIKYFGEDETEKICEWNNSLPVDTIRINPKKNDRDLFIQYLKSEKLFLNNKIESSHFVDVSSLSKLLRSDWFVKGNFSVQSRSSSLPVFALDPKPDDVIIDLCAAPGGKTSLMAELSGNKAKILAVDNKQSRNKLVFDTIARLDLKNVSVALGDGSSMKLPLAEKILIDAPCSGTGTINRKPDIKLHRNKNDINKLTKIQYSLLKNAAKFIKPGGIIVYSTCTIEPEENEEVIRRFLSEHENFMGVALPNIPVFDKRYENCMISVLPYKDNMDGSFIAKIQRML